MLDHRKDEAVERTFKGVAKNFRDIFAQVGLGGCALHAACAVRSACCARSARQSTPAPRIAFRACACAKGAGIARLRCRHSSSDSRACPPPPAAHPQLVPGGRGELVMQKRAAGEEEGEGEGEEEGGLAGPSSPRGGGGDTLSKYSGVKVKVGGRAGRAGISHGVSHGVDPPLMAMNLLQPAIQNPAEM